MSLPGAQGWMGGRCQRAEDAAIPIGQTLGETYAQMADQPVPRPTRWGTPLALPWLPVARVVQMPTASDLQAGERGAVRGALAPTPTVAAPALGPQAWLKLETLQPTGSFKVRGALAGPGQRC